MTIKLTFEVDGVEAAVALLRRVDVPLAEPVAVPAAAADQNSKPKRGKAKKTTPEVKVEYSADDVQKVLEQVFEAKGLPTAQAVLARFGVKRVRDLDTAQYATFVQKANAVLDGAAA